MCALAIVLVAGVLTATHIHATSVIAPTFDTLVKQADLIFTERMTSQRCEWQQLEGRRVILTHVTFQVSETHKGTASPEVTLQFLGGTIGETTMEVTAIPKFKPGERVVLFVEKNGVNASPVVGFFHGKFKLLADGSGAETVHRHDGAPLTAVAELGNPNQKAFSGAPMTHKDFVARIKETR